MSYAFDAGSILILTRELGERVLDVVGGNSTASLAYYEAGNALWKECNLLARLGVDEAAKALEFTISLLSFMEVIQLKDENLGVRTLFNAFKLNITYYDAAYLSVAEDLGKVLVTDDEKLATAAKEIGVKTLSSRSFIQEQNMI
ncbi:MAG: Exonuclease VapC9 [Candidatus Bathyarchaeota archaeon BA1]|nr:MAG: Exonuclease VapC9 [Candidatus Bathyarchaeota archaeon BA1]